MFLPHEQHAILTTPIGEKTPRDNVCWGFETKGNFTIKSACLVEIGYYETDPNTSYRDRKFWSKLVWSLSVLPKSKVFAWRAFNNLIPTGANMLEHHVPVSGHCDACHDRWGSTEHCLLFCPMTYKIWKWSHFSHVLRNCALLPLTAIASAIRNEFAKSDYELWIIMLWQTWIMLCKWKHGDRKEMEQVDEISCVALWDSFQNAKSILSRDNKLGFKLGERKWLKPGHGVLRVDVDASYFPDKSGYGVGVVIRDRDHMGFIKVAAAKHLKPTSGLLMTEIMAVVFGLMVSMQFDLMSIEVYTDSCLAAHLLADKDEDEDLIPEDIRDILDLANSNFL
ncbi:uncharacterized protein LOC131008432 [Salvia miltiorrhiza]|uniref:uncharacterized protein LOC131008432 n=1 Tax=Salvia miltiorrhiza TaxID=226208 RepID=UPI0025ACF9AF|nr:uncharacterized protein LOC131008432 [Salvia miltiorrhiza]